MSSHSPTKLRALPRWFVGEFVGTFLLVLFGCGSVYAAVLTVYILAPLLGALLGGALYRTCLRPAYAAA